MNYKYFKVIGLQRTGTNWLREIITSNFNDLEVPETFWKHLTPLGVKEGKVTRRYDSYYLDLKLRDDTFYIATMKDFDLWIKSLDRKPIDTYKTHMYNNDIKEVFDSWNNWRDTQLSMKNFYFKNYTDWLKNWKIYFEEIESITGWKRKHSEIIEPTSVPRSTDFALERYKDYL
jgi:hypothetical protein